MKNYIVMAMGNIIATPAYIPFSADDIHEAVREAGKIATNLANGNYYRFYLFEANDDFRRNLSDIAPEIPILSINTTPSVELSFNKA